MNTELTIGFIGNPNSGKTTLFNAYTGANLKVANWPGVTVEKKEGAMRFHNKTYKLVDLPGTYSLTSYSMEEIVSREFILSDEVDVLVNVADASALERNLYLTLQLIELGKPVVLALNMMDIVERRGFEIDIHRLPEMLGIPVIPVSARKKKGLEILIHAAAHHKEHTLQSPLIHHHQEDNPHHKEYSLVYSEEIETKIDLVEAELLKRYDLPNQRWYAIKLLEKDEEITRQYPIAESIIERSYETDIINQKYDFIEEILEEVLVGKEKTEAFTDKVDNLMAGKWLGLPVFLGIMAMVFLLTFQVGDWLKGYFESGLSLLSGGLVSLFDALGTGEMLTSLVVDGIVAGVGAILSFLPNIFILFLALAVLEDSGYMARVAYVMESIMRKLGLSGKAFIPMLLGFGCSVPAIMASRTLENRRDRYKVMMVTPFMSCSAKLPIYVLFSGMFFPKIAPLVAFSMYLLGVAVAILVAFVLHLFEKADSDNALLIELPEYKLPGLRTMFIYVWGKVKDYLVRAGTIIFLASIVMWFLLNFGPSGYGAGMGESFGALLGKGIVPVLAPVGLGYWQIAVALIAGITAKEVVVSSTAVLFGIPNVASENGENTLVAALAAIGFGPANALSLMVFCLLYVPCLATLAVIKKEAESWRFAGIVVVFQIGIAWAGAFCIYHISLLFPATL